MQNIGAFKSQSLYFKPILSFLEQAYNDFCGLILLKYQSQQFFLQNLFLLQILAYTSQLINQQIGMKISYLMQCAVLLTIIGVVASFSQYKVVSKFQNTTNIILDLQYTGKDQFYGNKKNPIIKQLTFILGTLYYKDFYFKIIDPNNKRYEIPKGGIYPQDPQPSNYSRIEQLLQFTYTEDPFDFKILNKQTKTIYFSTYEQTFIYSDHYIEIGTQIQSQFIYGIGERFSQSFRKKDGKWTVFSRDRAPTIDHGIGKQTFGYYPFYFMRERSKEFHINYFRSSNAMDIIKSTKENRHYLTYKVIGGVLDFKYFTFVSLDYLFKEIFHKYILNGQKVEMPPFWSLGYHQSRFGYKNVGMLEQVAKNFEINDIPLDTIWSDIDYMINNEDFTVNWLKFPLHRMKRLISKYHYIPIIDAGIKAVGRGYRKGVKENIYIMKADGSAPYVGKVWPGDTNFVDFFHPNATKYWHQQLNKLHSKLNFSGIWLDMNEIANLCDGDCKPQENVDFDYSKDLPYHPGSDNIQSQTISFNALHYGGLRQANVHVFNSLLETYATYQYFKTKKIKPFIVTRSSTFGSGLYANHWTGPNQSKWQYLRASIPDNFNSLMFGFKLYGADICGFRDDAEQQLCARWYQLGSLYPFARNHNYIESRPQEPYALGEKVLESARKNLKLRYSLLKQFYSILIIEGNIWNPLSFIFDHNSVVYKDHIADTQFMIGQKLLAAPILEPNATKRQVYFPQQFIQSALNTTYSNRRFWYDIYTGKSIKLGNHTITNHMTDEVPLFLRSEHLILIQDTKNVTKTNQLNNKFNVLAGMLPLSRQQQPIQHYWAKGSVLPIKDYNDDALIDKCLDLQCKYSFNLIAWVSQQKIQFFFIVFGDKQRQKEQFPNQQIIIQGIRLLFPEQIVQVPLQTPINVITNERIQFKFVIPRAQTQSKHINDNLLENNKLQTKKVLSSQ